MKDALKSWLTNYRSRKKRFDQQYTHPKDCYSWWWRPSRYLEQSTRAASKAGNGHSFLGASSANPMQRLGQDDDTSSWDYVIKKSSVVQADIIMNYIIEQKFALITINDMPAESIINTGRDILDSNPRYLSKFLTFKSADIQPSDVTQFRSMPPIPTSSGSTGVKVKNKYPAEQCMNYM